VTKYEANGKTTSNEAARTKRKLNLKCETKNTKNNNNNKSFKTTNNTN
jgi:hypothetical protein